jgi:hypothetical protein
LNHRNAVIMSINQAQKAIRDRERELRADAIDRRPKR